MTSDRQLPQEGRMTRWGRAGFNKSIKVSDWIAPYANSVSAKVGGERFWPQSDDMPIEIEKCARILRAFTVEGVAQKEKQEGEKVQDAKGNWMQKKVRVLRKIPPAAIRNAKGIAIYSLMRTGIAPFGGGGGSGVVMARLPDGSWSAPSAITPQNFAAGFLLGVDFLDVILLINSDKAMQSFMTHRVDLGAEIGVAAGPYGSGASAEAGLDRAPVYSYVRTRGAYAGVELMGQVFLHRFDENERFYYAPHITGEDILKGKVRMPPAAAPLHRALREAESGRAQGGKLERTELDVVKIPESEALKHLGPHASKERRRRFIAGDSGTPSGSSAPSAAGTPRRTSTDSKASLESLDPDNANGDRASGIPADGNALAQGNELEDENMALEDDFLHDGERLRLPPTPEEAEMMEAAGVLDEEDRRLLNEARKEIYALPPPPMHSKVKKYWDIHPNLAQKRPTGSLMMDGPNPPDVRTASLVPLPRTPQQVRKSLEMPDSGESSTKPSMPGTAVSGLPTETTASLDGEAFHDAGDVVAKDVSEAEANATLAAAKRGDDVDLLR